MSQHLIIRLGTGDDSPVNYAVVEDTNESVIESGVLRNTAEIQMLTAYFKLDLIVLLAGNNFFFKTITYPKRFNPSMKGSIPYMIESEVASDVDDLEVTVLNIQGRDVDIMACDKSYQQWVQSVLGHYGLLPSKMLVDIFTLPYQEGKVTVINLAGEFVFRTAQYSGMCLNQSLALKYFRAQAAPPSFHCLSEFPMDAEKDEAYVLMPMASMAFGALNCHITLSDAQRAQHRNFMMNTVIRPWLKVAVVLLAIFVVYYATLISNFFQYSAEGKHLKEDLVKVFKQKFPMVNKVVNPMAQFKQLTNQSGDAELEESFVKRLGEMLGSFTSKTSLLNFSYDDRRRQYHFKLSYREFDDVEGLKDALNGRGYSADISEIRSDKDVNTAMLTVEESGS